MEINPCKKKKPYQKPKLEADKVLEVHASTCCKNVGAGCSNALRDLDGKVNRNSSTS